MIDHNDKRAWRWADEGCNARIFDGKTCWIFVLLYRKVMWKGKRLGLPDPRDRTCVLTSKAGHWINPEESRTGKLSRKTLHILYLENLARRVHLRLSSYLCSLTWTAISLSLKPKVWATQLWSEKWLPAKVGIALPSKAFIKLSWHICRLTSSFAGLGHCSAVKKYMFVQKWKAPRSLQPQIAGCKTLYDVNTDVFPSHLISRPPKFWEAGFWERTIDGIISILHPLHCTYKPWSRAVSTDYQVETLYELQNPSKEDPNLESLQSLPWTCDSPCVSIGFQKVVAKICCP